MEVYIYIYLIFSYYKMYQSPRRSTPHGVELLVDAIRRKNIPPTTEYNPEYLKYIYEKQNAQRPPRPHSSRVIGSSDAHGYTDIDYTRPDAESLRRYSPEYQVELLDLMNMHQISLKEANELSIYYENMAKQKSLGGLGIDSEDPREPQILIDIEARRHQRWLNSIGRDR